MLNENAHSDTAHVSGIASAPGDLPMPALAERHALKSTQFRHDNKISPGVPRPDQAVAITATSGAALRIQRAEVWYTTDGSLPNAESSKVSMVLADVEWNAATSYLNRWEAMLPPQQDKTVVRYKIAGYSSDTSDTPAFFAHDGSGFWYQLGEAGLTTFAYQVQTQPRTLPDWMDDAIIYHIFLDRFRNGTEDGQFPKNLDPNDKHGGSLQGVINSLPYLAGIGVNCLWLSPIGPSPTYHRYDQSDYFAVDPVLGSLETLRELVKAAHAMNIRLILDFVPSHGSWKMPEFVAAQQDRDAPAASWFVFDEWPDKYRCFLGIATFLVSFNSNDAGLRQFLIDSASFWLEDVGFDGLRLDHAIGHGSDFWIAFSTAIEQVKPGAALFGEVTDTPEMLRTYHGRLQGVLDFPLAQMLRMSFGRGEWGVAELAGALQAYNRYMQTGPGRVTFIDNHDMNRFLFVAGGDVPRLKLASLCLFTLPFPPVLYYGTEIGLSQQQDKDAGGFGGDHVVRPDMVWDEALWDHDLLDFYKALIKLRHNQPALRRGRWETLAVHTESQVYRYRIVLGATELQVFFNLSNKPHELDLGSSSYSEPLLSTSKENRLRVRGAGMSLSLEGLSGVVLATTS